MKYLKGILLAFILLILLGSSVLAYTYSTTITVQETEGNAYTPLPIVVEIDNDMLATNNFIKTSALDTRVLYSGSEVSHMVSEDRTAFFAYSIFGDSTNNFEYTWGNSDLTDFPILVGDNGRFETADAAALELAQTFEIEFNGYVDTSTANYPIIYKPGAFLLDVSAAGTVTAGCINADSYDVTPGVFAAWTDVDVSDYVPDGASGVIVEIDTANNTKDTGVRKNGSTDSRNGDTEHYWAMIGLDSNRVFEVYLQDNTCHLYLRGYTDGNWVFKTDAVDVSLGGIGAWTDIDVTASTSSDATVAIIEIINNDGAALVNAGLRKNGSTDNRHPQIEPIGYHNFRVVGLDDSQIFEGYIGDTDVDFYLIGYAEDGATFATNATDKSLGVALAWTDVDCSTEAPDGTFLFYELEQTAALGSGIGLRENGATDNIVTDITRGQMTGIVKADMAQISENYEEAIANTSVYISGYTEYGVYPPYPKPTYLNSVSVGGGVLASGDKHITISGTGGGGNLVLDIDGSNNNVAIGAGVTNTTNNWRFMSRSITYLDDYYHTSSGALQITYLPTSMITSNTIIDETNAFDGTIMWGDNPSGIEITLGSTIPASQSTPVVTEETDPQDIIHTGGSTDPDTYNAPDDGTIARVAYDFFDELVTSLNTVSPIDLPSAMTILNLVSGLMAFLLMLFLAIKIPEHRFFAFLAGLGVFGLFAGLNFLPLWTVIVYVPLGVVFLMLERKPVL